MVESRRIEQFSTAELLSLRVELMQRGLDSWQAAEVLSVFLRGRGYGVNSTDARDIVGRMELSTCDVDAMQMELERVAMVM